ncbi:MAG: membrane protein insertase YidC [Sphingobacteriia bacterium]|nr:MAG: membrane protein insertase YidC [Sphingobacteriia bacterium]
MKGDKNTIIGFVLLGILFFLYFWFTNQQQSALLETKKREEDSLARVAAQQLQIKEKAAALALAARQDSTGADSTGKQLTAAALGTESLVHLRNEWVDVVLSNKGAQIKSVTLLQFKDGKGQPVVLADQNSLGYAINLAPGQSAQTDQLFFGAGAVEKLANGTEQVRFQLTAGNGQNIEHVFALAPQSYNVKWVVNINGAPQLLTANTLNLNWQVRTRQMERSASYERQVSSVCFTEDKSFDYIASKESHAFEKPGQWVSVTQQFFNNTLVADNGFQSGNLQWLRATDTTEQLAKATVDLQFKTPATASISLPFTFYIGPSDYVLLKQQAPDMEKIVNLGRDLYSFVRPINKYIIMQVFDFFAGFVKNYGWVILLLTIFIRLVTAPLTYSSYLSGAKMRVMRPELDALKKKFGDDQQGFAMEQMKIFREAGVNPLGGCIPALLQIPIFFSLYSFFNSNIALRGQAFLWSQDLSSFDSIATLPFTIPAFGNHISLFTITAVITSFLISIYNMSMTPTQDNPALKYMPYIFPFMLLFFFNSLPSALTWYYTVSNAVTLLLQFVIQNYIINHDKIVAQIEAKRKAPKTKSKWQEKYEQMMDSQKKLQDLKNRTNKK